MGVSDELIYMAAYAVGTAESEQKNGPKSINQLHQAAFG
jgi:hypothetical protein